MHKSAWLYLILYNKPMESKTLTEKSLEVIDQYLHFKIGSATTNVPYFNNKTAKIRAALRTHIGKGSPSEIHDEFQILATKERLDQQALTDKSLKKSLTDKNLGIECSGFAYHILEAESVDRGFGRLKKHLAFIGSKGLIGKLRSSFRPVENCNVTTFADNTNSKITALNEVRPGDIITMTNDIDPEAAERNHILIINEVVSDNSIPVKITYSHSVAYPEDGVYGTGVRQGEIEILNIDKPITEAKWTEEDKVGEPSITESKNRLYIRAQKSKTELRRLNWF